jgi:Tfp pilus assembly protein PilV
MSLLEALVALVILGVSVVGYLDVFSSASRSVMQAEEWERTVAIAESAMESALLGDALQAQVALGTPDERFTRSIAVEPWRGEMRQIIVTVGSPRGATFTLRRLVRDR